MLIKSISDVHAFEAGDLTQIQEILHPANDQVALTYSLAMASLPVGKASIPHILKTNAEVYIITEGQGEVHIDGNTADMKKGDVVYIPKGAKQHIINTGNDVLKFLCIVSPPWSAEEEEVL